jgi:glutathione-regulated potassium-efflux system ancillary protein KefG
LFKSQKIKITQIPAAYSSPGPGVIQNELHFLFSFNLMLKFDAMAKILLLFAHPVLEKSRVHAKLIQAVKKIPGITFHDLYESYPDFDIDVEDEKALLLSHDIIILQHPFYWYSAPPIVKQWLDLVLEYGWAYGKGGTALTGKYVLQIITAGGSAQVYHHDGRNRFTFREFLAPFDQSFNLCHMTYLTPYVIAGTHRMTLEEISDAAEKYTTLLEGLSKNYILPEQLMGNGHLDRFAEIVQLNAVKNG